MTIRTTLAALLAAVLALSGCAAKTTTTDSGDAAAGADTLADTGAGADTTATDTAADTAKPDVGKDTVKAEVGPTAVNWGICNIGTKDPNDTCMPDCYQSVCGQACGSDPKCIGFQDCVQKGCNATPMVMPPQDGTPVAALPGEATNSKAYCTRVCTIQAGPAALAEYYDFQNCAIGTCMDCSKPVTGLTKVQCQQLCGEVNGCIDTHDACFGDTDCLNVLGCIYACAQNDQACQKACTDGAKGNATAELSAFNDCITKSAKLCTAPTP